MGSSYRNSLNNGRMPEWESVLRNSINELEKITNDLSEMIGDDGQYDNAADDGALQENIYRAIELIKNELPMTKEEKLKKIEELERSLNRLKGTL